MLFPIIKSPVFTQESDKLRIHAGQSYIAKGTTAITLVEIDPGDGAGFLSVFDTKSDKWFLDYQYATEGDYIAQVKIGNGVDADTITSHTITVVTEANDYLYSTDIDISKHENDVLKYLPQSKNSFKYMHRRAQELILDWLYRNGYRKTGNIRLEKADIQDKKEVKEWATFLTLSLIFKDNDNSIGDIFAQKAEFYKVLAQESRGLYIKADWNSDGDVDPYESKNISSIRLVRC